MEEVTRRPERKGRAEWLELMAAYEAGELSQREFCRMNGVAYSTFGYWRRRLRAAPAEALAATTPSLLELSSIAHGEGEAPWRVEIDLGAGVRLRLR